MTPADRTGAIREPAARGRRRPTALPRPLGSLAPLRARIKVPILYPLSSIAVAAGGLPPPTEPLGSLAILGGDHHAQDLGHRRRAACELRGSDIGAGSGSAA